MQKLKGQVCYICSEKLKKDYFDIDVIVAPSGKNKNDGLVIQVKVDRCCMLTFYKKFFDMTEGEKCDSVKKPKKSSITTKQK